MINNEDVDDNSLSNTNTNKNIPQCSHDVFSIELNDIYQSQQLSLNSDVCPVSLIETTPVDSILLQTQEIEQIILKNRKSVPSPTFSTAPNSSTKNLMDFMPRGVLKEYLNLSSAVEKEKSGDSFDYAFDIYKDKDYEFPTFKMNVEDLFAVDRMQNLQEKDVTSKQTDKFKILQEHICTYSTIADRVICKTADVDGSPAAVPTILSEYKSDAFASSDENHLFLPANYENVAYNEDFINQERCSMRAISANNSTADATMIPSSVKQLYDVIKTKYSDFAFVYALSAQLCQDRMPMDCLVKLKMSLLLSLASFDANGDRPPIPIVVLGNDKHISNYLLSTVGQLATRFIDNSEFIRSTSTSSSRNRKWFEADPILLAKGGVYFVGDWSRLNLARADRIFKIVECSCISIENSMQSQPLTTAIWTHWCSFKNSKNEQTFNKFMKIFGVPIVDDLSHGVLTDFMLGQASANVFESSRDHLYISTDDMRSYLAVIAQRKVDLTAESSNLLQQYFVASRTERPHCLTKQGFIMLKQFAESFAKLSFRHEVLPIDAIAAIYLCESFIQDLFGANNNPAPPFKAHNFIGLVDTHFAQFQQWLDNYIAQHCNEINSSH